jgi:hypothetical protein
VLDGGHLAVWDTVQQRIVAEHPRPKPPPPPADAPKVELTLAGASATAFATTSVFAQSVTRFQQVVAGLPPAACVVHDTSPDAIAISPGGETVHFGGGGKGCIFAGRRALGGPRHPCWNTARPSRSSPCRPMASGSQSGTTRARSQCGR